MTEPGEVAEAGQARGAAVGVVAEERVRGLRCGRGDQAPHRHQHPTQNLHSIQENPDKTSLMEGPTSTERGNIPMLIYIGYETILEIQYTNGKRNSYLNRRQYQMGNCCDAFRLNGRDRKVLLFLNECALKYAENLYPTYILFYS